MLTRQQQMRSIVLLLLALLSLIMRDRPGDDGRCSNKRSVHGSACSKGSSPIFFFGVLPGEAAAAPKPSADARLRAAVTRSRRTVLRLTSDVSLAADLPNVTCPDLTVIGSCRTKSGRSRRCKIDGGKRFSGFYLRQGLNLTFEDVRMGAVPESVNLTLENLEITGFAKRGGKSNRFIDATASSVVMRNCVVTKNSFMGATTLIELYASGILVEDSSFIRNKGRLVGIAFGGMSGTDVLFRENQGATAIGAVGSGLECRRCAFENNTSELGPTAVWVMYQTLFTFSDSRFVGNRLEEVGGQGAVAAMSSSDGTFNNCEFRENSARLRNGGWRTDHVYVVDRRLTFCKQWPKTGITGELTYVEYLKDCT